MEKSIPAAETTGNQRTQLTQYSSTEQPWAIHRAQADFLEEIYITASEEWMTKYSGRISLCAQVLEYGFRTVDFGEIVFKFRRASFCRVRFCAICQWRRSLKWRARFLEAIPEIENQYPKARWVFLTLTLKNCHAKDLRTTVKHMADAFVRLTQTKKWPAIGWIRSLEVTHSTSTAGDCHPHYHVLLLVKPGYFGSQYVSQKDFASMWKKAARLEYDPICHVRAVKSKDGETIASVAAAETLKYSVKPDEMVADGDWLKAITAQLFKVRGVTVGGMLRDLMRPDEPEPDEDEPEPLNEGGFLFQYEKLDQEYYQIRDDQTAPESAKTTKSINDQVADSMDRWKERTKAKMSAPCTKCGQQFVRLAYNQVVCKTCHSKDKER